MKKNKIILGAVGLSILFLPLMILVLNTPSHKKLQTKKSIRAGFIETLNRSKIEIHLVWGNLFRPKKLHRDMGFDLVGVSCYFDPIHIDGDELLPTNPLLNSAIAESLQSEEEIEYLLSRIVEALNYSKEVIRCFMDGPQDRVCEGDQIVPYCWNAYTKSNMANEHGIKYLAALPIFNPDLLKERISEKETRSRLSQNVEAVTRRLINFSTDELYPTVRSIGMAAIGSTSDRGGDSRYFLEFSEGFLSILKGIENCRPSDSLDRISLVAYDQHKGIFKEDALNALQEGYRYLYLKRMKTGNLSKLIGGILAVLYFVFCLLSYQNYRKILRQNNRWNFIATLAGICGLVLGISWVGSIYISEAITTHNPKLFIGIYITLSLLCLIGIRWLGKHLTFIK